MSDISKSPAESEKKGPPQDIGDQAKVYAARMRLQNALDQADALDAIREIAGNLIGTEEVAVFKVDKKRSELWLYWSFGVDPNKHSVLEVGREPKLKQVLSGKSVFRLRLSNENLLSTDDPVSALVPILVDGTPCAVIVLFRLFPHKAGIQPVDREICEVLSHCAGRAIEPHHSR
ncbi:MAG TPA: hypothetical protein VN310_09170 [Candidatus Dormibacteraeota bacterium]|jgi:hypothetical protein|nr:hypothetical protein [Candidatus Dormibacteraeota bacterium]